MEYYGSRSTNKDLYTVLNHSIEEILSFIKPLDIDRDRRLNTINDLTNSIQSSEALKGLVTVQPFGSFVSNLYSKWGDLDISINLNYEIDSNAPRKKKINILKEIRKELQKRGIGRNMQFIPHARVPLLIYESRIYDISCDLSVDNHQGYIKSKIMELMTCLDERFADMVLLIKEWAKAQNINNSKSGTLNSYSLCLLVIFHLQTCEPAILPPIKEIYNGNISADVEGVEFKCEKQIEDCVSNIHKIISNISRVKNQSSLSELLVSFFDKFSGIEGIFSEYIICPFTSRWENIANHPKWAQKAHNILLIEDPFEQEENTARAVNANGLKTISDALNRTRQSLSPPSRSLSDRNSLIRLLSRPLVSSKLTNNNNNNNNNNNKKNSSSSKNYLYQRQGNYSANTSHYISNNNLHVRNQGVRINGNGLGQQSQPSNSANNLNRNHVNNNNNNRVRYTNQNYQRFEPNYNGAINNYNGGLSGIYDINGGMNGINNYNGGMNGILPTPARGLAGGSQNRSSLTGSNSTNQSNKQMWRPRFGN